MLVGYQTPVGWDVGHSLYGLLLQTPPLSRLHLLVEFQRWSLPSYITSDRQQSLNTMLDKQQISCHCSVLLTCPTSSSITSHLTCPSSLLSLPSPPPPPPLYFPSPPGSPSPLSSLRPSLPLYSPLPLYSLNPPSSPCCSSSPSFPPPHPLLLLSSSFFSTLLSSFSLFS